ncbi:uncharacterized protein BO72DRAFT_303606 [Aspergillus fijiensis CBS 313.89]|uniref:Uncharacterized protein n=1 Tax=Aspergillus fijiensis CBS 313.89 TaxID=1448319 RepID=A0A8G1W1G7_9EURO|nr:uncharacterized protein BO72DRAFT_303606 [Aspergillus fijiensis CBS 313.89]RAK80387.1 hypothetical protein BO72DRAFT_303606 [Aspergillus fijiensis CBS 313.89]
MTVTEAPWIGVSVPLNSIGRLGLDTSGGEAVRPFSWPLQATRPSKALPGAPPFASLSVEPHTARLRSLLIFFAQLTPALLPFPFPPLIRISVNRHHPHPSKCPTSRRKLMLLILPLPHALTGLVLSVNYVSIIYPH